MLDLPLAGKRLLIRQDLNVPLAEGKVSNDARVRAALPTLQAALDAGAAVMVMSHLGRPSEGEFSSEFSLAPVAERLGALLGREVPLVSDWINGVDVEPGAIVLCENVRFLRGEKADDEGLAKRMAALCDVFVMDAFGTAHRAQASTHGVAKFAQEACAGPLLDAELIALATALRDPARPLMAVVGGSKVSTKLTVLESLSETVDQLIVGGGIANTFIAAAGHDVGKSLYEPDLVAEAQQLMRKVQENGGNIPVPVDVVVAKAFSADAEATIKKVDQVDSDDMILDVGPETARQYAGIVGHAGTVVWNGPLGVFEFDAFANGTKVLGEAIANSSAFSIAGGGDTLAAVDQFGLGADISYISTGGGAFLEFLEGKALPGVEALRDRC